jgi:hypothetical protein
VQASGAQSFRRLLGTDPGERRAQSLCALLADVQDDGQSQRIVSGVHVLRRGKIGRDGAAFAAVGNGKDAADAGRRVSGEEQDVGT